METGIVNPNIPDVNRLTPLITAVDDVHVPPNLRGAMAWRLLRSPLTSVNQRGPDNKLSLQVVLGKGLGPQLSGAIIRRNLEDYNIIIRVGALELTEIRSSSCKYTYGFFGGSQCLC
jgi:hypothetical protein